MLTQVILRIALVTYHISPALLGRYFHPKSCDRKSAIAAVKASL